MVLKMTVETELASLSIPLQFLAFSDAYFDSASRLCTILSRSYRKSNYARGSVILYLTFHAIELFLKGAILERSPNEPVGKTHDLQTLNKRYRKVYPDKKFVLDAPFISRDETDIASLLGPEYLININVTEQKNPWDQRHRYPRNRDTQPWAGLVGFEPVSFLLEIKKLKADITRLEGLIFS